MMYAEYDDSFATIDLHCTHMNTQTVLQQCTSLHMTPGKVFVCAVVGGKCACKHTSIALDLVLVRDALGARKFTEG